MMRNLLFIAIFFSFCIPARTACAQEQAVNPDADSVAAPQWVITPRLNSAGHFPFTGSLINRNINADVNIFFEYRRYGFFLFQSFDLEDRHSIVNYLQPGIFRRFRLSPSVDLGVFFGYVFSQTSGFRDEDSDYYAATIAYWSITDKLKLENTTLFFDLSQNGKLANRLLLSWTVNKFRIDLLGWHRIAFADNVHATSSSLAVNFPRIRLSGMVSLQGTISYQGYLTTAKPDFARRRGFLFSIAFPLHLSG